MFKEKFHVYTPVYPTTVESSIWPDIRQRSNLVLGRISGNGQILYRAGYPATIKSGIGPISVNSQIWYWAGYPASLKSGIWPDTKYHKRLGYLVHPYNTVPILTQYILKFVYSNVQEGIIPIFYSVYKVIQIFCSVIFDLINLLILFIFKLKFCTMYYHKT